MTHPRHERPKRSAGRGGECGAGVPEVVEAEPDYADRLGGRDPDPPAQVAAPEIAALGRSEYEARRQRFDVGAKVPLELFDGERG